MAAADLILAIEVLVLAAMLLVWCVHKWATPTFKKRLYDRVQHRFPDGHWTD
jgi:hypothetical protein